MREGGYKTIGEGDVRRRGSTWKEELNNTTLVIWYMTGWSSILVLDRAVGISNFEVY